MTIQEPALKIAFLHAENKFNDQLYAELKAALPDHELLHWAAGDPAPATDLEMLFLMGSFTREQMAAQPKLAVIQTASAGYEGVDEDAATELGIWLSFAPSDVTGNGVSVAEFAVMLLLAASRRLTEALASIGDKAVKPEVHRALMGKTVAIIGMGSIGLLLAERLRPFGVKLQATDSQPERAPDFVKLFQPDQIPEAIADADYVVLAVRADKDNEDLFNAAMLAKMKRGAILVNIARGSLVDEMALLDAVEYGQIWAAGLDVIKEEPVSPGNALLNVPEIFVTPHIAGPTDLMIEGTVKYLVKATADFAAGNAPESVVNKPASPRLPLQQTSR